MQREDYLDKQSQPHLAQSCEDLRVELQNLREKYPNMGVTEWTRLVRAKYTRHMSRILLKPNELKKGAKILGDNAYSTDVLNSIKMKGNDVSKAKNCTPDVLADVNFENP